MELEKETNEESNEETDENASFPFTFPQSRHVFSRFRLRACHVQMPKRPVLVITSNNSEENDRKEEAVSAVSEKNGSQDNLHKKDSDSNCGASAGDDNQRNNLRHRKLENESSALLHSPFLSKAPLPLVKRIGSAVKNKYSPNSLNKGSKILNPRENDGNINSNRVLQDILNRDRRRALDYGTKPELNRNFQKISSKDNELNVGRTLLNKGDSGCKYITPSSAKGQDIGSEIPYFRQYSREASDKHEQIHKYKHPIDQEEQRNGKEICTPRVNQCRDRAVLTVKNNDYNVLSKIGCGGSSQVFQVLDPSGSTLLAVKCVDLTNTDKATAEGYLKEIELLLKFQKSDRVIKMIDHEHVESKMLYVVMEKGDIDLSTLLKKTSTKDMSMIIYYWTEMLHAVKEIHDHGVVHTDLKPANFLLVNGRLKLIDFGIASSIHKDVTSIIRNNMQGTCNYMSPENIQDPNDPKRAKVGYRSDVWSLGCILYYLLYGKTPFQHIINNLAKLQVICNPNHTIKFPSVDGCPPVLMEAVKRCLSYDAKKRPTVAELLSYPYICAINH